MNEALEAVVRASEKRGANRFELVAEIGRHLGATSIAEIGVYEGEFAEEVLKLYPDGLEKYIMIDPWRHLGDWNKPANEDSNTFERFMETALDRTKAHSGIIEVLRGTTMEVIDQIEDDSLDIVYIDGDHTLRGVAVDMMAVYPKLRDGGVIVGDDFSPTIWQHRLNFEPSLVFPFAVHFAEAHQHQIVGLSGNQFVLQKNSERGFGFVDLAGAYPDTSLLTQIKSRLSGRRLFAKAQNRLTRLIQNKPAR